MQRRGFLAAMFAAGAAPAIVKAESLMKIVVPPRRVFHQGGIVESIDFFVYQRAVMRQMAEAIGVPYEMLVQEPPRWSNYSSAREAILSIRGPLIVRGPASLPKTRVIWVDPSSTVS